jgi:hypothetical protein
MEIPAIYNTFQICTEVSSQRMGGPHFIGLIEKVEDMSLEAKSQAWLWRFVSGHGSSAFLPHWKGGDGIVYLATLFCADLSFSRFISLRT